MNVTKLVSTTLHCRVSQRLNRKKSLKYAYKVSAVWTKVKFLSHSNNKIMTCVLELMPLTARV